MESVTKPSTNAAQPQQPVSVDEIMTKLNMDFSLLRIRASLFELKKAKLETLKDMLNNGGLNNEQIEKAQSTISSLCDELINLPTS